ncbi:MAG: acyl-CoA dehydratase activase-related protein [Candidatus Izemoplasma sp.]|nr:acyl-CoA dehydratase activase-related protein [Candidatus Izemoplasma sp.]
MKRIGIDIGSTTIKTVIIDEANKIVYKDYLRHKSSITSSLLTLLKTVDQHFPEETMMVNFTGSAGMLLAKGINVQFTQEVISATMALKEDGGHFDVCIELGGEDAKIIFFDGNNIEQRMNGTCAGGTGAFIDQMATLINRQTPELNDLAKAHQKIYPIASRCGVFAKSDIQPLLNQGASHADIAASIYQAIVNQTIAGLSQGRTIEGRVAFLGGPLTFSSELRQRFITTLHLEDVFIPENGEVFVAYGAALEADTSELLIDHLIERVILHDQNNRKKVRKTLPALFKDKEELQTFIDRHNKNAVKERSLDTYHGNAYLGIDAGSTTTKMVLISDDNEILHYYYSHNQGNPIEIIKHALSELYQSMPKEVVIKGAYSTGYGEELIKHAFTLDGNEVETICHAKAAQFFNPDVDFIIDIGGQDMKCFKLDDGMITSIILNEACSSGCGSFLETFSTSMGYDIKAFAELALEATQPVDLGSRCTVFMNSGVKQAQADAAPTKDISAGLAYSVVKNALYKVIRTTNVKRDLGENIIVQGGTFYNNAVLRAFEKEIGMTVTRPNIAGLMGAFGAAIVAKEHATDTVSRIVTFNGLKDFTYETKNAVCRQCNNNCQLTINMFKDHKYISGNRCERGAGITQHKDDIPNLYLYKYNKIISYTSNHLNDYNYTIGIPLVLNMYENIPFWQTLFEDLNIEVIYSDRSNKALYELGQNSIPSDTACYPAKLVHGHIENLLTKDIDAIFYPNMPFNVVEKDYRDNEYNCPVVAFYPEVIDANLEHIDQKRYFKPYLSFNNKTHFVKNLIDVFKDVLPLKKRAVKQAYDKAIKAYQDYREDVIKEGERALKYAKEHHKNIILLAGRPYHIDPEINHGLPKLMRSLDVVVISEDSVNTKANQESVNVLNQWTYHTRLYDSAKFIAHVPNANMIQLVSFGCGLDAITSDEIKHILESHHQRYTQIKIDEVNNLGTANIRIRSLLSTMEGDPDNG